MSYFVDPLTGRLLDIRLPYVHPINGTKYGNLLDLQTRIDLQILEIPEPLPPEDYHPDKYDVVGLTSPPYLEYRPKSQTEQDNIRWERLKALRDAYTNGPYGCKVEVEPGVFKWFHTDQYSKLQQLGLETSAIAMLMQGGTMETLLSATPWKTMDGSKVALTVGLAIKVATAQKVRDQTIFAIAEAKKEDTSPLDQGWPEVYVPPPPPPPEPEVPPPEPEAPPEEPLPEGN